MNGFVDLSNVAVANITAAEGLASYNNIHPYYIQVCGGCHCVSNPLQVLLYSGFLPPQEKSQLLDQFNMRGRFRAAGRADCIGTAVKVTEA